VIVLDENIVDDQVELLRKWGVRFRLVGEDVARIAMPDGDILRLLHRLHQPTFFTRDADYRSPRLAHRKYCLVFLDVRSKEAAAYIRQVLRHSALNTAAKRLGAIVQASERGMRIWRLHKPSVWFNWQG
jgi:hypothetical protein